MMRRTNKVRFVPSCAGVKADDIAWQPTWQELEFDRWHAAKVLYEKEWLEAATKELALIAAVIERDARELALEEWRNRHEAWRREQAAKQAIEDKRQIVAHLAACQKALDAPRLAIETARLEHIGKEIRRDAAHFEKQELKRRGVLRGTR
jgi:hypothetical protein